MAKDWKLHLLHIIDCLDKIKIICERGDLSNDFILYDASLRNLQTLAESTSHIPQEITLEYPNIDWRAINGFRNILVHNYLGDIDPETVKNVITNYLPPLEIVIKKIMSNI